MSTKPPKQQIHVKANRRRGQSWADFAPIEHLQQHDRKVASLRRAEAVNDASLEVTAKRLADVFPNLGPHVAIVKAFLEKPANIIHDGNVRSKMQERHQKRLRLLKAITLGGETREAYCARTGTDTGDASRMLEHLCEKEADLRCAVEAISARIAATSSQNRQPEIPAVYNIDVGSRVDGLPILTPAVRLAVKTEQGLKVLVFRGGKSRNPHSTGTSKQIRQPEVSTCSIIVEGWTPAQTFTTQVGDCTWTLHCRDEEKGWQGIEGVYAPGNNMVTVGIGDDPWDELHLRSKSVTKGEFAQNSMAKSGSDALAHSKIGLQRPGETWVRVGPRILVEAHKDGDKLQVSTLTPPAVQVEPPCECEWCSGRRRKRRYHRWFGADWTDCEVTALHRAGRWNGKYSRADRAIKQKPVDEKITWRRIPEWKFARARCSVHDLIGGRHKTRMQFPLMPWEPEYAEYFSDPGTRPNAQEPIKEAGRTTAPSINETVSYPHKY